MTATVPRPTPEEIQLWLEFAGQQLMSLGTRSPKPQQYHVSWPEYADDPHTAYGYTKQRLRLPPPAPQDIVLMDHILNLVLLEPDPIRRRILNARALIRPINGQYLYSWSKIAFLVHLDRRQVKYQHQLGLETISQEVDLKAIKVILLAFGPSLSPLTTRPICA